MPGSKCLAFVFLTIAQLPCFGKEIVYLNTGFSLETESHRQENQTLVLQTRTGTISLPLASIERIEVVAAIPPTPENRKDVPGIAEERLPEELLRQAARAEGLPVELVRSVAQVESRLHPDAISMKGAVGLMQLMPTTAAELGVNASKPAENAQGGAKYLRELLIRYHHDSVLALAAYNAGPGSVQKYHGAPPYAETRRYIERVLREYNREMKRRAAKTSLTDVRGSEHRP